MPEIVEDYNSLRKSASFSPWLVFLAPVRGQRTEIGNRWNPGEWKNTHIIMETCSVQDHRHDQRKSVITTKRHAVRRSFCKLDWSFRCDLQILSGSVYHREQLHGKSTFLFSVLCVIYLIIFFLKRGQNWGRWKVLMSPLLRTHVKNYWGVFKCCNSKEPSWKKKVEGRVAPSWERLPLKFSVKKSRGLTTNFPALLSRLLNTCHLEPMW